VQFYVVYLRNAFQINDPWKDNEKVYEQLARPVNAKVGWLAVQPSLRADMRSILVGWLTEVHHEFHLSAKTLFLSVSYLDRLLLARGAISRTRFQLYGLTCLWIASKFEDVYTNSIQDLVWICDDAYARADFEQTEQEILKVCLFYFFFFKFSNVFFSFKKRCLNGVLLK
jgi:hypothetical protein